MIKNYFIYLLNLVISHIINIVNPYENFKQVLRLVGYMNYL